MNIPLEKQLVGIQRKISGGYWEMETRPFEIMMGRWITIWGWNESKGRYGKDTGLL